ncbi:MAG: ion transporter [Akkermansiaceae bacterium]
MDKPEEEESLRERLWKIIFEAETPLGKAFDVVLLGAIILSVFAVMLESVDHIALEWGPQLRVAEWVLTGMFTLEYFLRIALVRRPWRYIRSFYGVVDLLSCLPSYLSLFFVGTHSLLVIRILRLLRMFRVLKMMSHIRGAETIMRGLAASRAKITVFFISVLLIAVLAGTLMYLVENGQSGTQFTSIPMSIYYAIVSITTVGFGDMVAVTVLGKIITSALVLAGYAIIAVPTGIVTAGIMQGQLGDATTDACPSCGVHGHLPDAKFCRRCGENLH